MHWKRTHITEPLPDKYTRVTHPERFLPLQEFALELIAQLRNEYDVVDSTVFELIPGIMTTSNMRDRR